MKYKRYKKDFDYSYTLGASLTIEMLKTSPFLCIEVFYASDYNDKEDILFELCIKYNIMCTENSRQINALTDKQNCFVIGIFKKQSMKIKQNNHIVLVNPADMGNIGTIMRTCVGFGFSDIAIITTGADVFDPKTVRASMGAFFHCNTEYFSDFNVYRENFSDNKMYTFMLKGQSSLNEIDPCRPYSLIFGNESSGLDDKYLNIGTSIKIEHSNKIDSLSLPIAVGIALYKFSEKS